MISVPPKSQGDRGRLVLDFYCRSVEKIYHVESMHLYFTNTENLGFVVTLILQLVPYNQSLGQYFFVLCTDFQIQIPKNYSDPAPDRTLTQTSK